MIEAIEHFAHLSLTFQSNVLGEEHTYGQLGQFR